MTSSSSEDNYFIDQESSESLEKPVRVCKKRTKQEKTAETIEGKWSEEESIKYALFIDCHPQIFSSKEKRKATKIFVTLANFLGTRTPRQCRSHFQKLMTKFRKINKIRAHYESILGPLEYARRTNEVSQLFKVKESRVEPSPKELKSLEVQTEPLSIRLSDLDKPQLDKLLGLLEDRLRCPSTLASQESFNKLTILSENGSIYSMKRDLTE